ncbi:DUF4268 domain-containing protein [Solidesulfovibrio magneticus]|nr:DUF4268 domain-containing protein [Solidesulfovibrio magneticus]
MSTFGKLEKVDLRSGWLNEAGDFTPWLAQEENLSLLGDSINLQLELEAEEKNVGPFRADILCKDIATNEWVLVENQLEKTDHTHLGQLLTYAAGLDAATIIWVAASFTDEHRAALDWLNQITDDKFKFFGLEIELWKINDSLPAPKFNIISMPNDWLKSVTKAKTVVSSELTSTQSFYVEFWSGLFSQMKHHCKILKPTKPLPQNWMNISIGRSYARLTAAVSLKEGWIGVTLCLTGDISRQLYSMLEDQKDQIEQEYGHSLWWLGTPKKVESYISFRLNNVGLQDRERWASYFLWYVENLELFYKVLGKRVLNVDVKNFPNDNA